MKNKKKRQYENKKLRLNLLFILFLFYATSGYAQTSYFETSTPEAQGISSLNILKFIDRLETEIDAVHSFMIIRNGKPIGICDCLGKGKEKCKGNGWVRDGSGYQKCPYFQEF